LGNGNFLIGNANGEFQLWDTSGNLSSTLTFTPDYMRGYGMQSFTSSISTPSTSFCANSSTVLTVNGGTGNYQWYHNGAPLAGQTNSTYTATSGGLFNATYTDSLGVTDSTATGITLTVLPLPVLPGANIDSVCSGSPYMRMQFGLGTPGTTYNWGRSAVTGITPTTASGTGDIMETLINTTPAPVVVTYVDTMTGINGCVDIQNITVTVNPLPTIYPTALTGTICDGSTFTFTSTSLSDPNVTYSWSRAASAGNPAVSGTGAVISETLNNSSNAPVTITYVDTLKAYGCINWENVNVQVQPTPVLSSTLTPPSICDSAKFHYIATSPTSDITSITWTRGSITGISNASTSGADSVNEYLDNTTSAPIAVTYVFSLTAGSAACSNVETMNVVVNPTPRLNSTLTPSAICDSALFHYTSIPNNGADTIAWSRAAVAGITNPAATGGSGDINEHLHNTTPNPVSVTYTYTLTIAGCPHTDNVVVTVNPKPVLSNSNVTPKVCDNTPFTFTPSSATTPAPTYAWSRAYVAGIGALAKSDSGSIHDTLKNNTYIDVPNVVYIYTLTANGCSNTQKVTLTVHPTPLLNSDSVNVICSGVPFIYQPTSSTTTIPISYAWSRASVTGITPLTGSDTAGIHETLVNSTTSDKIVRYHITLTLRGTTCSHTDSIKLTVRPAAAPGTISIMPSTTLCAGTKYQNFGASTPPPSGTSYTWSATNATVWATSNNGQNAIISFNNAGPAIVTLNSSLGTGCKAAASYSVTVTGTAGSSPFVAYTSAHLICLQNDVTSFQWGYDDAATLDSTIIPGAIDQSYYLPTPDFGGKYYWVITKTADGCYKKSYYNAPTAITELNNTAGIKLYPNPASDNLNVEINTAATGNVRIDVLNLMGQKVNSVQSADRAATFNVANLPAGYYMVDCYIEGVKIGTARFIKN
jgi:hypothetical protein